MRQRRTVLSVCCAALVLLGATACESEDGGGDGAKGSPSATATHAARVPVPEKLDADGTTIHVGRPGAASAMHLYEDPRCPVCKDFEDSDGADVLRASTAAGDVRTDYTLASFLDDGLGGGGSKRAVNALRAALEEGHFAAYHDVLYANQPEERTDGFTTARLLALARKVEGLRGPAFDKAVRTMRYADFVTASEKAMERDGIQGTPGFVLDGRLIASGTSEKVTSGTGMALTLGSAGGAPLKAS
ncbi:thioredoxin domain-containing protein [Streptomyces sp. SID11385]|uniref:DsbA family protein n=1 Tax=Streptomyces sp. SID11385 TaxID=2706031 RepID=UPI0013C79CD3|nr:thioredoxin domain-containing protein [Streptomyces sp. SID11385]NEA42890.1 thioredoxin domain-containing protein [Streptomyces sp. SID11385]